MKSLLGVFFTTVVILICATGMAGCSNKSDKNDTDIKNEANEITDVSDVTDTDYSLVQGVYTFEENVIEIPEQASIADYFFDGSSMYFTYIIYPEYPQEPQNEAAQDETEEVETEENETEKNEAEETESKKAEEEIIQEEEFPNIYEDISDEELLDDLDDIFGDIGEENSQEEEYIYGETTAGISQEQNPQDNMTEIVFCRYDIETGEVTRLYNVAGSAGEDSTDIASYIDSDGNKKTVTEKYDINGNMTVIYSVTDKTGKIISTEDVTACFMKEGDNPDDIFIECSQAIVEDGTMYITVYGSENVEVVKFKDGKTEGTVLSEEDIAGVAIDNENKPIAILNGDVSKIVYLDFEKEKVGDVIYQPEDEYISGEIISGKNNIAFSLKSTAGISVFAAENKEKTDILNWLDCGLLADNIINIVMNDDGRLFCVYMDDSGEYKVGFLVRQEGEQVQKKVVEVVSLYNNYSLNEKIIEFNKTSDDCRIVYRNYEDKEEVEKSFANDIIAGKIPDIIDITGMDINNFMAKGLFEDLSPYLESDEEINRDYFVDGVLDVTAEDGKNYFLVKYFALTGFAGKMSEYGIYADGWTMNDVMDSYKSETGKKYIVPYESKSTVTYEFLFNDIASYVDWETGKTDFDTDIFKKALEFCDSFPEEDEETDIIKEVQNGTLMFNNVYLGDFNEMQLLEKMYDGDIVYLGIPSEEKTGMSFMCASDAYAISSTSECKEEAWEFIKYIMLSKENEMQGFPSSQTEFDKYVKRETATVEYTEEDGTVVRPKDEIANYDEFEVKLTPMKEETAGKLKELLKKSRMVSEEYEISFLIEDDITSYFDGEKTLDDTIKIIQDKVSKYVNENR